MTAVANVVDATWFLSPIPADKRRRLRQVFRYLKAHWSTPMPVRLVIRKVADRHDFVAGCALASGDTKSLEIVIDARACYCHAFDLLLHEYAHAICWKVPGPDHGPHWGGVFATLVAAFEDGDAIEESLSW